MKMNKNMILFTLLVILTITTLVSFSAVDYHGYTVYRDGVTLNLNWHAALLTTPNSLSSYPVTHHPGGSGYVRKGTWDEFRDGKNFMGVYRPKVAPISVHRDMFVAMARRLETENITYTVLNQISYTCPASEPIVKPEHINSIRCDGVIEYIYELQSYKVCGTTQNWDITRNTYWDYVAHTGLTNVSPKLQALSFMTKVDPNVPK